MKFNYESVGGGNGKYDKLPRVGEKKIFNIKEIRKVENGDPRFNFTRRVDVETKEGKKVKVDEDCGFRLDLILQDDKTVSVSNWKLFYTMREAGVQSGAYEFNHPDKGEWKIREVSDPDEISSDEIAWDE